MFVLVFCFSLSLVSAIFVPDSVGNCSDAEVRAVWDSVFVESSSGIGVYSQMGGNGSCINYGAAKVVGDMIYAISGSVGSNSLLLATSIDSPSVSSGFDPGVLDGLSFNNGIELASHILSNNFSNSKNRSLEISEAGGEFSGVFKILPLTFGFDSGSSELAYSFSDSDNSAGDKNLVGGVMANVSVNWVTYESVVSCQPNWTEMVSECGDDESYERYWVDSNSCGSVVGLPENETMYCDNNKDGVIGSIVSLTGPGVNLPIYIDSKQINLSQNYSGYGLSQIEFVENGRPIVEFNWNFNNGPLNLKNIYMSMGVSDGSSYIIINGIDERKSVLIKRENLSSNGVCIKNREISSVDRISRFCRDDYEIFVECPGSDLGYSCSLFDENYYRVSGLEKSAVLEFYEYLMGSVCEFDWTCGEWGGCVDGVQNRTCWDINNCDVDDGRPIESKSCGGCVPLWECTPWDPEDCERSDAGEEQVRTCTDSNDCGIDEGKPEENRDCENSSVFWIGLIVFLLFLGLLFILLIIYFYYKKQGGSVFKSNVYTPSNPSTPRETRPPVNSGVVKPVAQRPAVVVKPAVQQSTPVVRPTSNVVSPARPAVGQRPNVDYRQI